MLVPVSCVPKTGVLTLYGYGIQVSVDRGHLQIGDGIGPDRRHFRLARVGHGLRRLVVISSDGFVSLAALRWLADQGAAFVMLERDGSVLATTGPVRPSDARLRRAQALASHGGVALQVTRELLSKKLAGQEQVARKNLLNSSTANVIGQFCKAVQRAKTIDEIRYLESQAASAYWAAWLPLEQYAYRRDRSALDAVRHVHKLINTGHGEIVDADLSSYFDTLPHSELLKSVARRVVDGAMLHLIKMWLEAPVEETDERGNKRRSTRNRDEGRGSPQGSPIRPLLSNLYMRRFVLGWKKLGHERRLKAYIVNYADGTPVQMSNLRGGSPLIPIVRSGI